MDKTVICKSCGAEFEETAPKCPYCGTMNYKGAEAEYLGKLQGVRENLEDLEEIPQEATEKIAKKQGKVLKILLIIAGVIVALAVILSTTQRYLENKKAKEEMYWRLENYPVMNDMYDRGEYDEMYEHYRNGYEYGGDMYTWAHREFCDIYYYLLEARFIMEEEASGVELAEYDYQSLLFAQMCLLGTAYNQELSEDEQEILTALAEEEIEDFYSRWEMDEEALAQMEERFKAHNGYPEYEFCDNYAAQWYESREE